MAGFPPSGTGQYCTVRYDSGQNTLIQLEYPYLIGVVYAGK